MVRMAHVDLGAMERVARARRRMSGDGGVRSSFGERVTRWPAELACFAVVYLIYTAARWVFAGDPEPAQEHARWIWQLEESLGIAIEGSVQRGLSSGASNWLLSNVYLAAQFVIVPASLLWLYRRSRSVYGALRNTILTTWLLSVPIFALFPVAPPRLADLGLVDTVSDQAAVALTGSSTVFYNPFAAVPSLHVGFAFAVGTAIATAVQPRWAKLLGAAWGPIVSLTVVATANHYVFDVAAGLLVTGAGFVLGRFVAHRWQEYQATRALVQPESFSATGPRRMTVMPSNSAACES